MGRKVIGARSEPIQWLAETNGIRLNVAEQGEGPLVLLCHGFPESWYSWRHQIGVPADAGFRAVAPDMRGYGKSDQPEAIDQYTIFHLVGDLVGLLNALKAPIAVIVGHDWGSTVAWHAALLRPDRFRAVVGLSVPFRPYAKARPTSTMPRTEDARFYQLYFQEPGVAEAELQRDPRLTVRAMLFGASGDAPRGDANAGPGILQDPLPRLVPFRRKTLLLRPHDTSSSSTRGAVPPGPEASGDARWYWALRLDVEPVREATSGQLCRAGLESLSSAFPGMSRCPV